MDTDRWMDRYIHR